MLRRRLPVRGAQLIMINWGAVPAKCPRSATIVHGVSVISYTAMGMSELRSDQRDAYYPRWPEPSLCLCVARLLAMDGHMKGRKSGNTNAGMARLECA